MNITTRACYILNEKKKGGGLSASAGAVRSCGSEKAEVDRLESERV